MAAGKDLSAPVQEVMTERLLYCFDDESVDEVADNMARNQHSTIRNRRFEGSLWELQTEAPMNNFHETDRGIANASGNDGGNRSAAGQH